MVSSKTQEHASILAQVAYTKLDQVKNNLLNTCKTLMRRASEICNMIPGETAVPEELHEVSSVYLRHLSSILCLTHYFTTVCVCGFLPGLQPVA